MADLPTIAFSLLRREFFDAAGAPKPYTLRDKRNTQDDPLDEAVNDVLARSLPRGSSSVRSPGPLITPDLVLLRRELCEGARRATLAADTSRIVGIEVKKLERTARGGVARASGLDYNTTPPCGRVRVYDRAGDPLDIRGFYLFVCQEAAGKRRGRYSVTALVLCDGNLLNADFEYYLSIVGERTKEVGLGTYGDGANRTRPMLIFGNPLGITTFDHAATLVHPRDDIDEEVRDVVRVGVIERSVTGSRPITFHCYRQRRDVPKNHQPFRLRDPFPTPERSEQTQPRGRFRLDLRPGE